MPKRRADSDFVFSGDVTFQPVDDLPKLYRIARTTTPDPIIVERSSSCGTIRMHAPLAMPAARTNVTVQTAEPTFSMDKKDRYDFVFQGVVVRSEPNELLLSHGGMLCQISTAHDPLNVVPRGSHVRTVLTSLQGQGPRRP